MNAKHSASRQFLASGLFDGLNSFAEIEARISALLSNKERGDAFEVFAEAYLATQKINEAREVWPFEATPLEQRKLLSLDTGRDMGVDGTYQTHDGELRAYQVKFRSNRPALTWDELSTFMGLTDQVSQRVLFTNSETLPGLMRDRSGFIAIRGSDLDRLTPEDFEAMRLWLQSGQVKLSRKQPLPHQAEALTAISSELDNNDRATVVMACGTGKSLVALWATEQRGCRNILVLLPSLALVRQLLHEWLRETAWEKLAYLCVCSDPTVAKGADELIVHQAELDFPVTTESVAVGKFLGKPFDGVKVVFSTYQSAHIVAEGMLIGVNGEEKQPFDLAIFDEAHKTASRSGTQFSFALTDENLPIRKRLFFTATPRHYDIRKKDKEGDNALVYSMDRPEIYGRVTHTLSFAEAARRDIICDYKVVISVVTSEMVNDQLLKHGEVIVEGDAVKARQVALQIALQKAVEKYGVSRIFTFHGSIAAAKSFTSDDGEGIRHHLDGFKTLHVSGAMSTSEREGQINAFRQAQKAVISNARCLTEGVDVPAVDMVAFMSPRKSKVDIVQATGRAMRKSPGKQQGYVMVPLFLDMTASETIEEALHRTNFADVWDVLSAMKDQDDVLTDIIRQMREEKGRTGGYDESRLRERVEVLGPSVSLDVIRNSITAECLESLGENWDERFGELLAYKAENDSVNVPSSTTGLGAWVSRQRRARKILSIEKLHRLNAVDFIWDAFDYMWEASFNELLAYKAEKGNADVPNRWHTSLGQWVSGQRKAAKTHTFDPMRKQRLDEIGFDWGRDIPDDRKVGWAERFGELQAYKVEHDDIDVPLTWPTGLGTWLIRQRGDKRAGDLAEERLRQLSEIGFEWEPLESAWEARFNELLAYKVTHGDVNVQKRWGTTGLGEWLGTQRKNRNNVDFPAEKIQRLSEIGIDWDPVETAWESKFSELLAYRGEYGDVNVPCNWPTGLGTWAGAQRRNKKLGKISDKKVQRLNEVSFDWDVLQTQWAAKFDELLAYKAAYKHLNVPNNWSSGLGAWVGVQRRNKKLKKISEENEQRLNEIGFDWNPYETHWEEKFSELFEYKEKNGHMEIPQDYPSGLGEWISTQRKAKANDDLGSERELRLAEIGFSWNTKELVWDARVAELLAYKAEHGHVKVPPNWPTGLWSWINNQKSNWKRGELSNERIQRLNEIGFDWNPFGTLWEAKFCELFSYWEEYGNTNVPTNWPDGLNNWAKSQRKDKKKGNLSEEKIKRLDEIGFVWNPYETQWEEKFSELFEYKEENGHMGISQDYPSALRVWINNQKSNWKRGELSNERIQKLEKIGFEWERQKK